MASGQDADADVGVGSAADADVGVGSAAAAVSSSSGWDGSKGSDHNSI